MPLFPFQKLFMIKNIIATLLFATNTITPVYADSFPANPTGTGYMLYMQHDNQTTIDEDDYTTNVVFPNMNFTSIQTYIECSGTTTYNEQNINTYNTYIQNGISNSGVNNYIHLNIYYYFNQNRIFLSFEYGGVINGTNVFGTLTTHTMFNNEYIKIDPIYFLNTPSQKINKFLAQTQNNYNRVQWNETIESTTTRTETINDVVYNQYVQYYKNSINTNYINVISNTYTESVYYKSPTDTQFYTSGDYFYRTEGLLNYKAYRHCQLRITEIDTYTGTNNAILTSSNNFKVDNAGTHTKIISTVYYSYDPIFQQYINLPMGNTMYYTSKLFQEIRTLTNTWEEAGTKEFTITTTNNQQNTFNHFVNIPLENGTRNNIGTTYVMQFIYAEEYLPLSYVQTYNIFTPATSNITHKITGSITYEVINIPDLLFGILTMPFSFISTFFDIQLFPGTPYYVNIANLMLSIIAALIFIIIIRKLIKK